MTWDELQELIRVYNLVIETSGQRDFNQIVGIDDFINRLNLLIEEVALSTQ